MSEKQIGYLSVLIGVLSAILISIRLTTFMVSDEIGINSGMYSSLAWVILGMAPILFLFSGILWFFVIKNRIRSVYLFIASVASALYMPLFYYLYPFLPYSKLPENKILILIGIILFVVLPIIFKVKENRHKSNRQRNADSSTEAPSQ
jgi:hypothetical protein